MSPTATATWFVDDQLHTRDYDTSDVALAAMRTVPWALGLPTWEREAGIRTWIYQDCLTDECARPNRYSDNAHVGGAHAHRIGFYMIEPAGTATEIVSVTPRTRFPQWAAQ
ncbi:hypothetical protein [Nocardia sp. NPDC004860]|uniref:hypothetical protein n=1 Tax=Nocardia sp. NPDC004860 TaxID=3154557 RepID=UPI0033B7145E